MVSHDQRIKDSADRVLWMEDGEFKDMVTMVSDPVCGMAVEREKALTAEWEGQIYDFCSRGCRSEFVANQGSRDVAVLATDPVCGMAVERAKALVIA